MSAGAGTPDTCGYCDEPVTGRFCEVCGYDTAGVAPIGVSGTTGSTDMPASDSGPGLVLEVVADRVWYDRVRAAAGPDAASVVFPDHCPPRSFRLQGDQLSVGRRSVSRGIFPDIDLTGPPVDAGISALHLVLLAGDSHSWEVLDPGSTNGVVINDESAAVPPNTRRAVTSGDVIHLGAWTSMAVVEELS